ncbi:Uncharacterised protein [uncultured archaeon]|nr:Uncharacterised protein [uncultured archaeon]
MTTRIKLRFLNFKLLRLDADLRLRLLEKIGIYSNRFGIQEPKILFTTKEVLEMPKDITQGRRTSAYKYLGVSYLQHNLVFINMKKIPDEKTLENTIVHELIHMRFQYLSHGRRFNKLVRQGLAGKTFTPYKKRK